MHTRGRRQASASATLRYNNLYQLIEVDTFEEIMDFVEKYNRIVIEKLEDDKGETRYVIEIYDYWRE